MARQTGPKKFVGRKGNVIHYRIKGVDGYFARKASDAVFKDRMHRDPRYVRVREHWMETKGMATLYHFLRPAWNPVAGRCLTKRSFAQSQLMKVCWRVRKFSLGGRGQRNFTVSANKGLWSGVELEQGLDLGTVFRAGFSVSALPGRVGAVLQSGPFSGASDLLAPAGATHFEVVLSVGGVSDLVFDAGVSGYVPVDHSGNGAYGVGSSGVLSIGSGFSSGVRVTASLAGIGALGSGVSLVCVVGVCFWQRVDGVDYAVAGGGSGRVEVVF